MAILIENIKQLVGVRERPQLLKGEAVKQLPSIENAYLIVEGDEIAAFGSMDDLGYHKITEIVDASGQFVLPCWCDSHTHLVFAASRESEFLDKINGKTYAEIAANGENDGRYFSRKIYE